MSSNNLKISIITVCFNSAKTIERTIRSVAAQDYPDIEYIIVDGGSTDGTLDIIHQYEDRISRFVSEPDAGIYDAMNKGIQMATGDYITFVNSDDWYNEGAVSYVAGDIMKRGAAISCYGINLFDKDGIMEWDDTFARDIHNIRFAMCRCHNAIFAKRSVFEMYGGFDLAYKISADYDWLLRAYDNGVEISYDNFPAVNFRLGGVSFVQETKMRKEARTIALLALDKLKERKKVTEKEYAEIRSKIEDYYEKAKLDKIIRTVIEEELIGKNDDIKKELKKIFPEEKCSIFGCGNFGRECFRILQQGGISVECFWDNNPQSWGTVCSGLEVKSPGEIENTRMKIIIATELYFKDISRQLKALGMKNDEDYINYNDIRHKVGKRFESVIAETA